MPNLPGLEALRRLTHQADEVKTIMLTGGIEKKEILEALQLGARGVVLKNAVATDLVKSMRAVVDGQYWLDGKAVVNLVQVLRDLMTATASPARNTFGLTRRELQIVGLIVQGCTNKDVANECHIAEETVKRHLKNIFDKLGVSSRLELAMYAVNHQMIEN
jgi:DNA-binding NarL/FixJ family response regulator